jgi:hypothetical protein
VIWGGTVEAELGAAGSPRQSGGHVIRNRVGCGWLAQSRPEYLSEFQTIADLTSLPTEISAAAE